MKERLRVLALLPPSTVAQIHGESQFNCVLDLATCGYEAGLRWFWHVVLPTRYQKDVSERDFPPGCKLVFVDSDCPEYYAEIAHTHPKLIKMFNQQFGTHPVDAVWTARTVAGVAWQRVLSRVTQKAPMPVTILEPLVDDAKAIAQESEMMLRAMSALSCNYILLTSEEKRLALESYGKYLSGTMLRRLDESCKVIPLGIDIPAMDRALSKAGKAEKFTLLYGGRVAAIKRVDFIKKVMDFFYAGGRDVRNVITTQTVGSKLMEELSGSGSVEWLTGLGRPGFHEKAASAHVFICASTQEGEPAGFLEGWFLAGLALFPERPWARAILPPNYPYVYGSMEQAIAMLDSLYVKYDESWAIKSREWIRANFNIKAQALKHLEATTQGVDLWKGPSPTSSLRQAVQEISRSFETEKAVTWESYVKSVKAKVSVSPFGGMVRNEAPGVYDYYKMFLECGWQDTCESEFPVFERVYGGQ